MVGSEVSPASSYFRIKSRQCSTTSGVKAKISVSQSVADTFSRNAVVLGRKLRYLVFEVQPPLPVMIQWPHPRKKTVSNKARDQVAGHSLYDWR